MRASIAGVVAASADAINGQEREGTLHSLVLDKGFGFIRPAGGGDNVFFHKSELMVGALADLPAQAPLRFTLVKTDRGLVARDVRPMQDVQDGA